MEGIQKLGPLWGSFLVDAEKHPKGIKNEVILIKNLNALNQNGKLDKISNLRFLVHRLAELIPSQSISDCNKIIFIKALNNVLGFVEEQENTSDLNSMYQIFRDKVNPKINEHKESEEMNKLISQTFEPFIEQKIKEVSEKFEKLTLDPDQADYVKAENSKILHEGFKKVKKAFKDHHVKNIKELTEEEKETLNRERENLIKNNGNFDFLIKNAPSGFSKEKIMALIALKVFIETGKDLYLELNKKKFYSPDYDSELFDKMLIVCELWNYIESWHDYKSEITQLVSCKNTEVEFAKKRMETHYYVYLLEVIDTHPEDSTAEEKKIREERAKEILRDLKTGYETGNLEIAAKISKYQEAIKKEFGIDFDTLDSQAEVPEWVQQELNS